jgi:peptide/nickel transport system substrate-binding protein
MTAEQTGSKKKYLKINVLKRPIIIGGTIAAVAIAGIVSGIIIFMGTPKGGILNVGITYEVSEIDPILSVTAAEQIIINQVTETLFENDYIGGRSQIKNNLAIDCEWNTNATELTCFLREGVRFHDGTPFNAVAVKWNFDRVPQIINPSNLLEISWGYLFFLPDGRWIINKTQVINPYTVKFVLNDHFVPFRALLTSSATGILSPASTPANKTLHKETDDIVGTGPFIYDGYDPNVNITLSPNQNYWGIKPKIDKIVLLLYPNSITRGDDLWYALLNNEIHMLDKDYFSKSFNKSLEILKSVPGITVQEGTAPLNYRFIGMDNNKINTTMRKAISYAINYSQIVEIIPNTIKPKSPIPEGILYSNTTGIVVPYYNISKARQILITAGWPGTAELTANDNVSSGNEWEKLAKSNPLARYNLSYMPWLFFSEGMSRPFPDNLKQIGINVTRQLWMNTPYQLFTTGWIYDYNDPHNAMFDYHSKTSWVYLNDSAIDEWIENGVKETNPILREKIYYNIQKRLIEEIYPVILTFSTQNFEVYVSNLKGWHLTPFKTLLKTVFFI